MSLYNHVRNNVAATYVHIVYSYIYVIKLEMFSQ